MLGNMVKHGPLEYSILLLCFFVTNWKKTSSLYINVFNKDKDLPQRGSSDINREVFSFSRLFVVSSFHITSAYSYLLKRDPHIA